MKKIHVIFVVASLFALQGVRIAMASQFLSSEEVCQRLVKDDKLTRAIRSVITSWPGFVNAFRRPSKHRGGFLVTVIQNEGDQLVPLGIEVRKIEGTKIYGLAVPNRLLAHFGNEISCDTANVVDWRYIDTFECEGGYVYKELYARQTGLVRNKLSIHEVQNDCNSQDAHLPECMPFILVRKERVSLDLRNFMRDIANHRYEKVETSLQKRHDWRTKTLKMPTYFSTIRGRELGLEQTCAGHYGAMFGDERMLSILRKHRALEYQLEVPGPLFAASRIGNEETTNYLCSLGFKANQRHDDGTPLLHQAMDGFATPRIVAVLISEGADVNDVDKHNCNSVFFARDTEIATELLRHGVDLTLLYYERETCVQFHLSLGREELARFLVRRGAPREDCPEAFLREADLSIGRAELLNYAKNELSENEHGSLKDFFAMDYGYVLPVEFLPAGK